MKVENFSRRPTDQIEELIEYVARCAAFRPLKVIVKDKWSRNLNAYDKARMPPDGRGTTGEMYRDTNGIEVRIWLSVPLVYPRLDAWQMYGFDPQLVKTWEEEFLLVVAHEFTHVQQAATGFDFAMHPNKAEVEAETEARATLLAFRDTVVIKGVRLPFIRIEEGVDYCGQRLDAITQKLRKRSNHGLGDAFMRD